MAHGAPIDATRGGLAFTCASGRTDTRIISFSNKEKIKEKSGYEQCGLQMVFVFLLRFATIRDFVLQMFLFFLFLQLATIHVSLFV
jgi:hypothetical protein